MRFFIAVLLLIMAASVVFGAGGTQGGSTAQAGPTANFNPSGLPIVKEKITLKGFGNQNVTHKDWNDIWCFNETEKRTNIHIDWTTVPNQGFAERKNVLMASGDYPDLFFRCAFTIADQVNYGSKGIFIPLNNLIEKYGANIKARFQEEPSMAKSLRMPDGNIYTLAYRYGSVATMQRNWINSRWLKNLNLNIPATIDELEAVFNAFKTRDANGNGNPNDEIPFSCREFGATIFDSTYSAFGIGNLGRIQFPNYIDLGPDNKVRIFAITDNFRQQLEWIAKLYAQGLLDPEMFTQDISVFTAKGEQDLVGAFFGGDNSSVIGAKNYQYFVTAPPFKGRTGQAVFNNLGANFVIGTSAISGQSKYPAETLRWLDFFYGEEGATILYLGQEGVTFVKQPDGKRTLTPLITNNPNGLNMPQSIGQYAIAWAGGGCPVYATDEMERARQPQIVYDTYEVLKPYVKVAGIPILSFTVKEQEELNPIIADMIAYINEARVQFITGRRQLSQWDAYVRDIKNMGADRYTAIYQAAYDRWK